MNKKREYRKRKDSELFEESKQDADILKSYKESRQQEILDLWSRIESELPPKTVKKVFPVKQLGAVAAVLVLLIAIPAVMHSMQNDFVLQSDKKGDTNFETSKESAGKSEDIKDSMQAEEDVSEENMSEEDIVLAEEDTVLAEENTEQVAWTMQIQVLSAEAGKVTGQVLADESGNYSDGDEVELEYDSMEWKEEEFSEEMQLQVTEEKGILEILQIL